MTKTLQKTLTTTDKSAKALVAASANLTKVATELGVFAESAAELAIEIEFKQSELDGINDGIAVTTRKANAEIALQILENEDKVFENLLKSRKLARVSIAEFDQINTDLDIARSATEKEVSKAVGAATQKLIGEQSLELKTVEAEQSVETATLKAQIQALTVQNESLSESNHDLKGMLEAERDARIQVAKAATPVQQTVVKG